MSVADKLRRARENRVEIGGFAFTVRRPTDLEMFDLRADLKPARFLPYVTGWDKVREIDVLPGGSPEPLPFDAETRDEWLADRPDLLVPLFERIVALYESHMQRLGDAEKK